MALLLALSRFSVYTIGWKLELLITFLAIAFISLGIFLHRVYVHKKHVPAKRIMNEKQIRQLGISTRELQVLHEMATGKSNLEIANALFIAESTVKTHVSNLLVKLDAKRRTEAIKKAKEGGIIS